MKKFDMLSLASSLLSAVKRSWFRSVRRQIMLTFALAFAVLSSGFLLYLITQQQKFFHTRSEEQAIHLASVLATNSMSWVLANDVVGLQETIHALSGAPELRYAMVISPRGEVLAHSDPALVGSILADAPGRALLKAPALPRKVAETDSMVDAAAPILFQDRLIGWARIGLSRAYYIDNLQNMAYHGILYLLFAIMLGSAFALLAAQRLTGGLYRLMQVMQQVKNGQRQLRAHMKYDDEIAALGNDFNSMLDALDENEQKLRSIYENSSDALMLLNEDGFIDCNQRTLEIFGLSSKSAFVKLHPADISPPLQPDGQDSLSAANEKITTAFAQGAIRFEWLHRRSNGEDFPAEVRFSAFDYGGQRVLQATVQDISERKQAEAMRRELAAIVVSSREAIIGKNLDGIITSWNEGAERVYGYSAEEIIGKPISCLAPEDLKDEITGLINEILCGKVVENHETVRIRKDGQRIHVDLTLSPIRDSTGQLSGISTFARDITERKLAELALRHSEESLAKAQSIAHLGNWEWDIVGGHLTWSDEIYRIFGLTPQQFDATYEAFLERVHPDDRQAVTRAVDDALQQRKLYHIDHRIVLPDGRMRHVHEQAEVNVDADGHPLSMLGTVQDITEQKEAELMLRRLNRALRTLSACNEVLVHATDEGVLLQQMCNVIIERSGHRLVWVGFVEHDQERSVRPVAKAGHDEGYVDALHVTWAETERGLGGVGKAVRSKKPFIVQDTATDPGFGAWRSAALERGYGSVITLPLLENKQVFGVMCIYAAEPSAFTPEEVKLLQELASDLAFGISTLRTRGERDLAMQERQRHLDQLRTNLEDAVQAIAATVEMRDPYTAGHQRRVADLAAAIAHEMGLSDEEVHGIHLAGIVHDLGKISVPAEILSKPSALSRLEYRLIQVHPQTGHDILRNIDFPWPVADMVLQHHERLDGSGYPQQLKDGEILLGARILAIADTIEAMASHRPYRPGKGIDAALAEIEQGRGRLYDAAGTDACLRLFREKNYVLDNPSIQRA